MVSNHRCRDKTEPMLTNGIKPYHIPYKILFEVLSIHCLYVLSKNIFSQNIEKGVFYLRYIYNPNKQLVKITIHQPFFFSF